MSEVTKNQFAEGDLINPDGLKTLLQDSIWPETEQFTITGSLLDYRLDEFADILECQRTGGEITYRIEFDWPDDLDSDNRVEERSRTQDSFLRAGLTRPSNMDEVMEKLRFHDDVIIGIDTNILWDCTLTSILLEEIYKGDFPNWILIAVPSLVMAETENAANNTFGGNHPRAGGPVYHGRIGHRALQEVMDIQKPNPDRRGLSMITVGELDQGAQVDRNNWKLDSLIRMQFQQFLNDISFHKGTFFLSQDRVNVMMSGTEGSEGLYLQKPAIDEFRSATISNKDLSNLLYELCLQYGSVGMRSPERGEILELGIFWAGKQVSDWRNSMMHVEKHDIT